MQTSLIFIQEKFKLFSLKEKLIKLQTIFIQIKLKLLCLKTKLLQLQSNMSQYMVTDSAKEEPRMESDQISLSSSVKEQEPVKKSTGCFATSCLKSTSTENKSEGENTKNGFGFGFGSGGGFGFGRKGLTQAKPTESVGVRCCATHITHTPSYTFSTPAPVSTPAPSYEISVWIPQNKGMVSFLKRMETFARWPKQLKQQPYELCASGFYYPGVGDTVRCFFCGVGIHSWEMDDYIPFEHKKHSRNCKFAEMTGDIEVEF